MWFGNKAGELADSEVFAPYNRLVAYWPLIDYAGALRTTSYKPSELVLSNGGATYDASGIHDRGAIVGSAVFEPTDFMGRSDGSGILLPPAGDSFTWLLWVQFNTLDGGNILAYQIGGSRRYSLYYEGSGAVDSRIVWSIESASQTYSVDAEAFAGEDFDQSIPESDVWYLIECFYDGPGRRAGIRIVAKGNPNVGNAQEVAVPDGFNRSAAALRFGATLTSPGFNGRLVCAGLWHRRLRTIEIRRILAADDATPTTPLDHPNGILTDPWDWNVWDEDLASGDGLVRAQRQAGDAPSDVVYAGGAVSFKDNSAGAYKHEIWRDDGEGFYLLATLKEGVTSYDDPTAITEDSVFGTEGGDATFITEGSGVEMEPEGLSRYKARAIGFGDPSDFSPIYDLNTAETMATEGDDAAMATEGEDPFELE